MRITTKGQVTIPLHIREKMGLTPGTEIDFVEKSGQVYIVKRPVATRAPRSRFHALRGTATVRMTTNAIMALTRADTGSDKPEENR